MRPSLAPSVLAALEQAEAYPEDASASAGVERVQTHISDVFLTRRRVYKFRKAVDLGFLRFADRAERNADCLREVALNRRLAPDVYVGVAPLESCDGTHRIGPAGEELSTAGGEAPEHCVVMRRLPDGRDALTLLEAGRLSAEQVDLLATRIARFHDAVGLGLPAPFDPETWLGICTQPFRDSLGLLGRTDGEALAPARVAAVAAAAERFVQRWGARFEARRRAGRAVDGHGDLHLQHAWFESDDEAPLVIDCLEFNADLRRIDAASDVAFTAMDLAYRARRDLGERFLRGYARERDDFDLYGVVDYFAAYRAAVRAKVAALAAADTGIDPAQRRAAGASATRHLELAGELLEHPGPGRLALVAGTVGSGKSTLAAALAEEVGGVIVSSDRVRKSLAGLAPDERGGEELYRPEARSSVYQALLERARPVLESGRAVWLDATWALRGDRAAAAALAREVGADFCVLQATCPPEEARRRLTRRAAEGGDASDAGPERLAGSLAEFEAPDADESRCWREVSTHGAGWRERAVRIAADAAPSPVGTAAPQA